MKEKATELMNAIYSEDEKQKKKIEKTRNAFANVTEFILENLQDSRTNKELKLLKENSYLKYGIINLIDLLEDRIETRGIKRYLDDLISGNCFYEKEKQKSDFEKWIEVERNLKNEKRKI